VYIREAHAADVWPIDGPHVLEPRSTEQRIDTASKFQQATGLLWPIAVDGVQDAFLEAFAPWPFRFFVFKHGKLVLKTSPVSGTHLTEDVEMILRDFETTGGA
jgi:hypothetical protein